MNNDSDNDRPVGRCIILNYKHFFDLKKLRKGTESDVAELRSTFRALHFEFRVHDDLTAEKTEKKLEKGGGKTKTMIEWQQNMIEQVIL